MAALPLFKEVLRLASEIQRFARALESLGAADRDDDIITARLGESVRLVTDVVGLQIVQIELLKLAGRQPLRLVGGTRYGPRGPEAA